MRRLAMWAVLAVAAAGCGSGGEAGPAGAAGTARAYAVVLPATPSFDAARTKNFTAVARPTTGIYCLTPAAGIDPTNTIAMVSVEWGASSGSDLLVYAENGVFDCPAGTFEIRTYNNFTTPTLTNSVAFQVLVP